MRASLRMSVCAALFALGMTGCASMHWPTWKKPDWDFLDIPALKEYRDSPKSYVEIALEHDFLVRVKPWERGVLARHDMSWAPDGLEEARRSHTFFSKEASMPGGSVGGGGCGCN
jgi:hypothetical protein